MEIYNLICELLEEPVVQEDNGIVFTSKSIELIHEIAEKCSTIPIVEKIQETDRIEEYAEDLTAEAVFVDMLNKIVNAPTRIHMEMSVKMLIPIISRKLKENTFDTNIITMRENLILKLKRLKEYEDTGLTPEQIRDIDSLYLEKCEQVNVLKEFVEVTCQKEKLRRKAE